MGMMRFSVWPPDRLTEETVQQVYLSGMDRVAWQVQAAMDGGELTLRRAVSDPGCLHVPWPVAGHGRPTLATGSLSEEFGPHQLPVELARGTIGNLRNQMADWQTIGLVVPEKILQITSEAMGHLRRAAVAREDRQASAAAAEESIRLGLDASELLVAAYVDQLITVRHRGGAKLSSLLGADLGNSLLDDYTAKQFLGTFNAAVVPLGWREVEAIEGSRYWTVGDKQIEWCAAHGLKVCGGPLLALDPRGLPDWLYLWEDDFDDLTSFISEFISSAVERYRGKVDLWQCAARTNSADVLSLSEDQKLWLTARAVELVRSLDPETPAVVAFDQPWAEYAGRREIDFPPLQFADALIRAGLDLSGLMLEINLGYHPGGTLPRTTLELSRQLDHWSLLGLPLFVSISVPSAYHDDPQARRHVRLHQGSWTPQSQQTWAARCVPLILSKPYVRGIFWNQLRDAEPHDFPHGGLFDHRRNGKPALRTLASIRKAHLK